MRCLRMRAAAWTLTLAALLSPPLIASPAHAATPWKDVVAARNAAKKAANLEKEGELEAALAAFEESLKLNWSSSVMRETAALERKLGRLIAARDRLQEVADHPRANLTHKAKAKKELEEVKAEIPTLTLQLPADFAGEVRVDGELVAASELAEPMLRDPGKVEVVASADGYLEFREQIELEPKARVDLEVTLKKKPKPKPKAAAPAKNDDSDTGGSSQVTFGWLSLGVGIVGVGVGTYFGLSASSTRSDLRDSCSNGVCPASERNKVDDGEQAADISTAGFIIGAVGLAAGVTLLLTAPSEDNRAETALRVSPQSISLRQTF